MTRFKRYWLEVAVGLLIAGSSGYAFLSSSYYVAGGALLFPSLICYLSCFALTSFFLNRQQVGLPDRMVYSILSMVAGIVLLEIVYHYGFGIPGLHAFLKYELLFFGNQSANGYFELDWYLLILSTLFIGRKYMAFNKPLIVIVVAGAAIMLAWIGSGYPQVFSPPYVAAYDPLNIKYSSPAMIITYGQFFSGIAKIIAVIPAFFFNKQIKRLTA